MSTSVNPTTPGPTYSTASSGGGNATGAASSGSSSSERILELCAKIMERDEKKTEKALENAANSEDKTAMLRATSAQGIQQANVTACSNLVKGNSESIQATARRN